MTKKKTKILGFDSWTRGRHHFERLIPAFESEGMQLTLLHLGSWGNEPSRPKEEVIGSLHTKDIAFYDGIGFERILQNEKPDLVIFLSTRTFAHRSFQRYCRKMRIPTINLYHGLVRVQSVDNGRAYDIDRVEHAKFVLSKLYKSIRYTWPNYALSLWKTSASFREWVRFGQDILWSAFGKENLRASDDARTTKCCVYTDKDIQHAVNTYSFSRKDVVSVGNPDLIRFGLTQDMIGINLNISEMIYDEIMYIDTALVATGLIFSGKNDFISHIVKTRDSLANQGKKMLFKPHPALFREGIVAKLKELGIEIIDNDTFISRLRYCLACIVETTTLAMAPALMGMPLFLANYGKLENLRFGEVLTSYPRAKMLTNVNELSHLLENKETNSDVGAVQDWIVENSGPLPAEKMPFRVTDVVRQLLPLAMESD